MALDKTLKIYDDQGNEVDYDILAKDVKFLPDGKDLPTKLAELEDEIGEGGYTPPVGGIPKTDLAPDVQTSLGKADTALQSADKNELQTAITSLQNTLNTLIGSGNVQGAIDTFNEVVAFLNGIDTDDPTLFNQLKSLSDAITALQTSLAGKISGIKTSDNTPLTPDSNGIVTLPPAGSTIYPATAAPSMDGTAAVGSSAKYAREDHVHPHDTSKQDAIADLAAIRTGAAAGATALQPSDVSVETPATPDGTFELNVGSDTYTINLNHTHEGMAKLVVCEESDLPSTLQTDTIYAQVDDATNPTEIESLWIAGLEFVGGGVPAGTPVITKPTNGSTINLGTADGNGGSYADILIKGKSLTAALTVAVANGFTIDYGLLTGQSSVTIPAADANLGATVRVSAAAMGTDGAMTVIGSTDNISVAVDLTSDVWEDLAGVKLTGTQWLQTDYYPNANTEFLLTVHYEAKAGSNAYPATGDRNILLSCALATGRTYAYSVYGPARTSQDDTYGSYNLWHINENNNRNGNNVFQRNDYGGSGEQSIYTSDGFVIQYTKASNHGVFTTKAANGTGLKSVDTTLKTTTEEHPMRIGYGRWAQSQEDKINALFDITVESMIFTESGEEVRHWVPKKKNGTAGLYDTVNNTFIISETSMPLVAVALT